jgi:hypothetical protein
VVLGLAVLVASWMRLVALAFRYAARQVPRAVLLDAWPGKPATIERVLGTARRGH